MNSDLMLWILTLLPIVISPGPANILYAASGSAFGIKKTVPFWFATNITSVFQTLAVGFGLSSLLLLYPNINIFIKYLGILFLLYLAYKFYHMSVSQTENIKPLSFKDGVIIELLNMKYLLIPTIMFSQFYTPSDGYIQIFILSFSLLAMTLLSSMIWIVGGKQLSTFVQNEKMEKRQSLFFSILLLITAVWLSF